MSRPFDLVRRMGESRAAVAALLALALGVRLYAVYHARFDRDEAAAWEAAVGIARGEAFPALGPGLSRSDARTPGPLFFYLMAVPHLVTPHPLAGGVFVALLNVGALALLFAAFRDGWDPAAGALWLVTTACSPWSVAYADRAWTPNIFVPMLAVVLWSAVRMGRVPESRAAAILAFTLVAGFQVHLPALYLWPVAAVALAVLRPRINRRWLAAGALAAALTYAPYVAARDRHRLLEHPRAAEPGADGRAGPPRGRGPRLPVAEHGDHGRELPRGPRVLVGFRPGGVLDRRRPGPDGGALRRPAGASAAVRRAGRGVGARPRRPGARSPDEGGATTSAPGSSRGSSPRASRRSGSSISPRAAGASRTT